MKKEVTSSCSLFIQLLLVSSLFWDILQSILVVTDVSGQPINPIFKILAVQETSVTNYQSWLCNIPEE